MVSHLQRGIGVLLEGVSPFTSASGSWSVLCLVTSQTFTLTSTLGSSVDSGFVSPVP